MKKTRLFAAMTAALMTVSAMPIMASAVENSDMTVTYTKSNTYTLSIPASITIDENGTITGENTLGVSEINVDETTSKLQLKVSDNTVHLKRVNDTGKGVKSAVTVTSSKNPNATFNDTSLSSTVVIGEYTGYSATAVKNQTISFGTIENDDNTTQIESGTYTGTLTFTAEIVDG